MAIGIEGRQPYFVSGFDRENVQIADRDNPATTQRIDGAGSGARVGGQVVQNENSVTSGTWSEGFSQLRIGSWTVCEIACAATSGVAHI